MSLMKVKVIKRAIDRIQNAGGTVENGVTDLELEIRLTRKKYDVIQEPKFVTANLAGGLGNLLFEIEMHIHLD